MGKNFYFLAGLHRSGNTVLSAILNQHPDIYSSPISSLVEHMWVCHDTVQKFESVRANDLDRQRSISMVSGMINSYYKDIDKSIIFDRNKAWANEENINVLKTYVTDKPKIVFTTRPILECIASFIAIDKNNLIISMDIDGFIKNKNLNDNENIADYLVSIYSNFGKLRLWALDSLDEPENSGIIHVVKYEDLLNTPQETMDKIYDFLEIDGFKHNFSNIKKIEEYNDAVIGFSENLHKVRRVLGKGDVKVEEYLTPYTIEKYKDLRYF